MATDHRATLAGIKRFDQLVRYLKDPMGWPIDGGDFEELTFEYTPEELGIDAGNAAKIQEIKRLRPLSASQPWGIFFVKFEPKRLPVVALRRILSQVALKKRASANSAERAAWAADDLLFISNYGEGDERQISFAHFSQPQERNDLPTLKVLGWDNLDTALHLDAVAKELTQHLSWPEDDTDVNAWRQRWRGAFTLRHREVITTSMDLSIRLAELARAICERIKSALAIESAKGPLTKLMTAFRESLVHDLDIDGFADMYAQTIAYGLLSARIADPTRKTADDFAAHMRTSPFLRELMETFLHVGGRRGKAGGPGIDFDELGVSEVTGLLDQANMEAIVRDFGDRNRQEDPVIHFYELFLTAYDKQKKIQRGVFYTPQPVVSYIVRSVHELLQTEFGLADGLADTSTWGEMLKKHPTLKFPPLTDEPNEKRTISPDEPFVQILDPATGTATFLVEVIDVVHRTLAAKWKQQRLTDAQQLAAWNEYVPRHLLPRMHAFELMMAPYAIAHMKVGLKLAETGYRFGSEERARIYLTNALEPWVKQLPLIGFDALAHEAAAVNEIKRHKRFTVVIGNPPYSNFGQLNKIPYILSLLEDYKRGLDEKKFNITDDFIKFVKFAQHAIDGTRVGVVGMITNNVFVDGLTHRRMRQSLLESFPVCFTLDLHGSVKKQDAGPDGSKDENVFDIQQGVAISLWAKSLARSATVRHCSYLGTRESKYRALSIGGIATGNWTTVEAAPPHFFFCPSRLDEHSEYMSWMGLREIFTIGAGGLESMNDRLTVSFGKADLAHVVNDLHEMPLKEFRSRYEVDDSAGWKLESAWMDVKSQKNPGALLRQINYRPFDVRWTYYSGNQGFLSRPRFDLFRHLTHSKNIGLCSMRQSRAGEEPAFFAIRGLAGKDVVSALDRGTVFPLYLANKSSEQDGQLLSEEMHANFTDAFLRQVNEAIKQGGSARRIPPGLMAEEIFHYAYAVFHSPNYRACYAAFLKIDFPRLPLTGNYELFLALARCGAELTALHLLESPKLVKPLTEVIGGRNPEVEKISWSRDTVWVDKAQTIGFRGVREDVWNFHIGGYQVCEKWLKDRKGRTLTKDDLTHYQKIVVALAETIRLMAEIDNVIDRHGGWPTAFQPARQVDDGVKTGADVIPLPAKAPKVSAPVRYQQEPIEWLKAAEPSPQYLKGAQAAPADAKPVQIETSDMMARVRQVLGDSQARHREVAIRDVAHDLGYQRVSGQVREALDDALRTAVHRGILSNDSGMLRIATRAIDDYDRGFLKDQFLAALDGRGWINRDDAIRGFARWLGFRRTGPSIDETARSLINGLLREGRLESQGGEIRRT